jgi:hypothetical protein
MKNSERVCVEGEKKQDGLDSPMDSRRGRCVMRPGLVFGGQDFHMRKTVEERVLRRK